MDVKKIKEIFLSFFESKAHEYIPPSSLINTEDSSLMFTNAGMNQFKSYFLGEKDPLCSRATNIQKCIRISGKHNDLEEVGKDTYHHTMFEMMGNWSFADYYKAKAIAWAWELLTEHYKIQKENLYVTTFGGDLSENIPKDEESLFLWKKIIPQERIIDNCGKVDNFWEMGLQGPCGPSSEIHIDLRDDKEKQVVRGYDLVNTGHPLVIEIWNLVFIEYERLNNGRLIPLKSKYVDTGMGLERLAMVLQSQKSTYDTDVFRSIIIEIEAISKTKYKDNSLTDIAIRVIADHIRTITYLLIDGLLPSNTKAGYVLRRLIRRAVLYGYRSLKLTSPFLYKISSYLLKSKKIENPKLYEIAIQIEKIILEEEKNFFNTLQTGIGLFNKKISNLKPQENIINGADAFELYDTYGFPLDLTILLASEYKLTVDQNGFEKCLEQQKIRSKKDFSVEYGDWILIHEEVTPEFVGYDFFEFQTEILKYRKHKKNEIENFQIVLCSSPFFPTKGGQMGDTGILIFGNQTIEVIDTIEENGIILHITKSLPNAIETLCIAKINKTKREDITKNHSATHLLHSALEECLNLKIEQRGSCITERGFSFDFSYEDKINKDQLQKIEMVVNENIRNNLQKKEIRKIPFLEAKKLNLHFSKETRYGEIVRLISFGNDYASALCGGTHVKATGEIGFFKIMTEQSKGIGIRRIEAVTGRKAEEYVQRNIQTIGLIEMALKNPKDIVIAIQDLRENNLVLKKKIVNYLSIISDNIIEKISVNFISKDNIIFSVEILFLNENVEVQSIINAMQKKIVNHYLIFINSNSITIKISNEVLTRVAFNAIELLFEVEKKFDIKGGGAEGFAMGSMRSRINLYDLKKFVCKTLDLE